MARTPKQIRKWIKEEKRIIKLMYQKGLLDKIDSLDAFYFAEYKHTSKRYKSGKYRWYVYLPEIHFCTRDYWGEYDEHGVIDTLLQDIHWEGYIGPEFNEDGTLSKDEEFTSKWLKRSEIIPYLKSLPTIKKDCKINKILNRSNSN